MSRRVQVIGFYLDSLITVEPLATPVKRPFQGFFVEQYLNLLDTCVDSRDLKLFLDEELGYQLLNDCSLVSAPYQADGEYIGVLGVLGSAGMA